VFKAMTMAPPAPKIIAKAGAPEKAKPMMAMAAQNSDVILLRAKLANAKKRSAEKESCASAGVAS
jgi:hypothetical protein